MISGSGPRPRLRNSQRHSSPLPHAAARPALPGRADPHVCAARRTGT